MGTLTLHRKKRVRRIVVKDMANRKVSEKKRKKYPPTKKQLQKAENKRILEERKKRAAENIEKQKEIVKAKKMAVRALNKKLKSDYPVWDKCLPLPIGIDKEIIKKFEGELSNVAMRELIGNHCQKRKYLENIVKGKRYDLFTGDVIAKIPQDAINKAQKLLDRFNQLAGNQ